MILGTFRITRLEAQRPTVTCWYSLGTLQCRTHHYSKEYIRYLIKPMPPSLEPLNASARKKIRPSRFHVLLWLSQDYSPSVTTAGSSASASSAIATGGMASVGAWMFLRALERLAQTSFWQSVDESAAISCKCFRPWGSSLSLSLGTNQTHVAKDTHGRRLHISTLRTWASWPADLLGIYPNTLYRESTNANVYTLLFRWL